MKILVVRFSSLGDVVLTTAAIEALREDVPGAELHFLTKPIYHEVFEHHPAVQLVQWDPRAGLYRLASKLRRAGYDLIADLHGNLRTRLLRYLVPRPRWVRLDKRSMARRAAVWFRSPALLSGEHVIDRYLSALGRVGVRPIRRRPRIHVPEHQRQRARQLLEQAGWDGAAPIVALAPAGRWGAKAWPVTHWQSLLALLRHDGQQVFPVLIGGPGEEVVCEQVLGQARGTILAGRVSVPETAAMLELAGVAVTNDSAPMHIAQAVGTPVVALFGPTIPEFGFYPTGPRDQLLQVAVPCRPCSLHGGHTCPLQHHRCMNDIAPADVLAAIARALRDLPASVVSAAQEPGGPQGGDAV